MGPREINLTKKFISEINEIYTKFKGVYGTGKNQWAKGVDACNSLEELYHKCATNNDHVIEKLKLEMLAIKRKLNEGQEIVLEITSKGWFGRETKNKQIIKNDFKDFITAIEALINKPEFNQGLIEERAADGEAAGPSNIDVGNLVNTQLEQLKKELENKLKQDLEEKTRLLDERVKLRETVLLENAAESTKVLTEDNRVLAISEVSHQRANALGDSASVATGMSVSNAGVDLPDNQKDFNLEKRFYAALSRLGVNSEKLEQDEKFIFYRAAFTLINRIGSSSAYFKDKNDKDLPFDKRPVQYQLLYKSVLSLFTIKDIALLKAQLEDLMSNSKLEDKHKLKLGVMCREMPAAGINPLANEKVSKTFLMAIYAREINNYQNEIEVNKSRVAVAGYYVINDIHKAVKKALGAADEKSVKPARVKQRLFDDASRNGASSASSSVPAQQSQEDAPAQQMSIN